MKKISYFLVFLISLGISFCSFGLKNDRIDHIRVEGRGNNKYESKIVAIDNGMRNAAKIIANNMKVQNFDTNALNYTNLKSIFSILESKDEDSNENYYSAELSFGYNSKKLIDLFSRYGDYSEELDYYEYLVIPVIKRKNNIVTPQSGIKMFDYWQNSKKDMDVYSLMYLDDFSFLKGVITYRNFAKPNFRKIYDLSPNKKYKAILIVAIEKLSSNKEHKSHLAVDFISITPENEISFMSDVVTIENPNDQDEYRDLIMRVIENTINIYGELNPNKEVALDLNETNTNEREYFFNTEVYSEKELNKIKSILEELGEVDIVKNSDVLYTIKIATELTEGAIAEFLYEKSFTYQARDDGNFLMKLDIGA